MIKTSIERVVISSAHHKFSIVVQHWRNEFPSMFLDGNSSALYIHIFEGCPLYKKYEPAKKDTYPDVPWELNGGVTFYRTRTTHRENNTWMKEQIIGADYQHYFDAERHETSEEKQARVLRDAEELFLLLEKECENNEAS